MVTQVSQLGHNNPPSQIDATRDTADGLNAWLSEQPVIQTEEQARAAKIWSDRAALCLKDLDDERKTQVQPLNEQVKQINNRYNEPKTLLERVHAELRTRLSIYLQAETEKRQAAARAAREAAEAARSAAQAAEEREQQAREEASVGTVVDIGKATSQADQAFADYERAERAASLAGREEKVKIGGGFRRAMSLRTKETLVVSDPTLALHTLGWTEDMLTAIVSAARAYRTAHGKLPPGVISQQERSL